MELLLASENCPLPSHEMRRAVDESVSQLYNYAAGLRTQMRDRLRDRMIDPPVASWWDETPKELCSKITFPARMTVRSLALIALASAGLVITVKTVRYVMSSSYWRARLQRTVEGLRSVVLDWAGQPMCYAPLLRERFRKLQDVHISLQEGHTHPESAAWRSTALTKARELALQLGYNPYVFQGSKYDRRHGAKVSMSYNSVKQLDVPATAFNPAPSDLVVMVDADFHVEDLNSLLLDIPGPVMLYTFQPHNAAVSEGEFCYYFNVDGTITYKVSGGGEYRHAVWNYQRDHFIVRSGFTTRVYTVDRLAANAHHEFVLLIPQRQWFGLASMLANSVFADKQLERMNPIVGSYAVLDRKTRTSIERSVAPLGSYVSCTLPAAKFQEMQLYAKNSPSTITVWRCHRECAKAPEGSGIAGSVLHDYLAAKHNIAPMTVYPAEYSVCKYVFRSEWTNSFDDAPLIMKPYMSPLLDNCFVPLLTKENERGMLDARMAEPQAHAHKVQRINNPMMQKLMGEFIEMMIPDDLHLHPVDDAEVLARQNRPSQRALYARGDGGEDGDSIPMFMKKEPYQKPTAPRGIANPMPKKKMDAARYMYALADHIMSDPVKYKFYTFGKTPKQIAEHVADICSSVSHFVLLTDFSKMDGHYIARSLERALCMRAFDQAYHPELSKLLDGFTFVELLTQEFKEKLKTMLQRLSGEAFTALFNTILTRFMYYVACRLAGLSPQEAWDKDCACAGDDFIGPEITGDKQADRDAMCAAAADVGQETEIEFVMRGEIGVNYLSRYFTPEVFHNDPASVCDLKRILSKLHVAATLNSATPIEKLAQKLTGLALTDASTPIIRDLVEIARRVGLPHVAPGDLNPLARAGQVSWWAQFAVSEQWPQLGPDANEHWVEYFLPNSDIEPLMHYLYQKVRLPVHLLTMPMIVPRRDPVEVAMDTSGDACAVDGQDVPARPTRPAPFPPVVVTSELRYTEAEAPAPLAPAVPPSLNLRPAIYYHDAPVCLFSSKTERAIGRLPLTDGVVDIFWRTAKELEVKETEIISAELDHYRFCPCLFDRSCEKMLGSPHCADFALIIKSLPMEEIMRVLELDLRAGKLKHDARGHYYSSGEIDSYTKGFQKLVSSQWIGGRASSPEAPTPVYVPTTPPGCGTPQYRPDSPSFALSLQHAYDLEEKIPATRAMRAETLGVERPAHPSEIATLQRLENLTLEPATGPTAPRKEVAWPKQFCREHFRGRCKPKTCKNQHPVVCPAQSKSKTCTDKTCRAEHLEPAHLWVFQAAEVAAPARA